MYANFPRYAEVDKDLRNWLNEGNIRLQQLYAHPFTPDMKVYLFIYFLFSITKHLLTILTYKQCMVLTLLTKLYSTYKTILIYNVRYLRY